MPPLFRKEVLEAQRQRLHGDVLIVTPLSIAVVTGWLLVTLLVVGTFAFLGTYARTERVPGYLVPSKGLVKVAPPRSGVLRDARARVREDVEAGQVLAVVQSEAPSLTGDTAAAIALQSLGDQERLLERQIRLEDDRLVRERSRLEAARDSLNAQIASFEEQRELQRELTGSARSAFEKVQGMLEGGFISVVESERRRQSWLAHHLEEKRQARQLTELRARLTDVDHQLAELPQEVALRMSRLESQIADIEQREAELEGRRGTWSRPRSPVPSPRFAISPARSFLRNSRWHPYFPPAANSRRNSSFPAGRRDSLRRASRFACCMPRFRTSDLAPTRG